MPLPDFLLIGATKSGTTSLYHALQQHSQIFMGTVKEPHFFAYPDKTVCFEGPGDDQITNRMIVSDRAAYEALFTEAKPIQRKGEASAMYIYVPTAARTIYQLQPKMKLIAVLRNPIERAYSAYQHMRRDGREPIAEFLTAFAAEEERRAQNWSPIFYYRDMGMYNQQLQRYLTLFPREQLLVLLYEDLKADWQTQFQKICHFLEIDVLPDDAVALDRHNKSGMPKSTTLHRFLRTSHPVKELLKPFVPYAVRKRVVTELTNRNLESARRMSAEEYSMLADYYDADITALSKTLSRDLSKWLNYQETKHVQQLASR